MNEQPETIVIAWVQAINNREFDAFDQLLDPSYINHHPPPGGQDGGVAGLKDFLRGLCAAIAGFQYEIEEIDALHDTVTVRLVGRGRQVAALPQLMLADRDVEITVTHRFAVRDGRIQERWGDPENPFTVRPLDPEPTA
ncbi:MAG: ester cyclase [Solirubrobacteraceae bacterium]